ncbi:MAG: PDZ domain-containing protein [Phycisphaerales bacterium]
MGHRIGRTPWLGMVVLLGLATGCRMFNRGITESILERGACDQWQVRYGSRVMYTLTNDTLTDVEFEGSTIAGDVVVRYQRGLGPQAQGIADRTADLVNKVRERTGIAISTRTTVYLIRFDQKPQNYDITLSVEPNEFPVPLFVRVGEESCDAIIAQNHGYPYLMMHELVETSLVAGAGGLILPDLSWQGLVLRADFNNYTRWFREGLANYAGHVAYEIVATEIPSEQRLPYREALLHANPFTSLATIKDKLFSWPQSSVTEHERTYYNAALGLFLLIADTYGEQTIPYITCEVAQQETLDGRDLVEIVNRVIGTDVRRLVEEFEFPSLGVELERMSPALALNRGIDLHEGVFVQSVRPGEAAEKAGLKGKDVIVAVGSTPVTNLLEFELGAFRARTEPSISLTIFRQGAGTLTLDVPLTKPESQKDTPPGKRRNPLEEGRIEFSRSSRHPAP